MTMSGSSSAVECFLAKEEVAGANPVSRSKNLYELVASDSDFLVSRARDGSTVLSVGCIKSDIIYIYEDY